jgi:putative endonuclease
MPQENPYCVYILSSRSRAIYIGVTSDLIGRLACHRSGAIPGHASRYRITRLVYFESTADVHAAIAREKQLKGWRREKQGAFDRVDESDLGRSGGSLVRGTGSHRQHPSRSLAALGMTAEGLRNRLYPLRPRLQCPTLETPPISGANPP